MKHVINLKPKWFAKILSGEKTLEGRLNDEKRQLIAIGDEIIFYKEPSKTTCFTAKCTNKHFYKNFNEVSNNADLLKLGFGGYSSTQVEAVYSKFYSKEKQNKYGVVLLEVEVISKIFNNITN